jgi:drug/metabolite transporter (DMT)-like permease
MWCRASVSHSLGSRHPMPAKPSSPSTAAHGGAALGGHLALVFVQVFFALFPIAGKFAFEDGAFTPSSIVAWRIGFGAASLLGVAVLIHGRGALPRARDLPMLALCSFLGVTANMELYLEGLARSTATNAGLMMCLIPVFTFAIAAAMKQEKFQATRAVGVAVALVGTSMLYWAEKPEIARLHGLGNLLMVCNTLCYAFYLVLSRPLLGRYPPLVLIAWVFVLAHGERMVPDASPQAWWSMAFILVFPTSVAYLLNAFALARVRASTTAIYIYAQPLITGVASRILLKEEMTRGTAVSAACVFTGIWLVSRGRDRGTPAAAKA